MSDEFEFVDREHWDETQRVLESLGADRAKVLAKCASEGGVLLAPPEAIDPPEGSSPDSPAAIEPIGGLRGWKLQAKALANLFHPHNLWRNATANPDDAWKALLLGSATAIGLWFVFPVVALPAGLAVVLGSPNADALVKGIEREAIAKYDHDHPGSVCPTAKVYAWDGSPIDSERVPQWCWQVRVRVGSTGGPDEEYYLTGSALKTFF